MYIQLEVMIPLSLHVLSVLLYTPVEFLVRGKHLKIFTSVNCFSLHPCIFITIHPCNVIQVEGSHPST